MWEGECESYRAAPYASRVTFSRAVRDLIEAHGMTWAYWEFAAGCGTYEPNTGAVQVELRDALFF